MKPSHRPARPHFSSGPCAKRPGWAAHNLRTALIGRSHRSGPGKARIKKVLDLSRSTLALPDDYLIGIVAASDTGAVEMALWNLLGPRGVDMLAFDNFGQGWVTDVQKQLKLEDVRVFEADYGSLPDLTQVDPDRDLVFTWNGTTSGVRVPNGNWIASERAGLVICDATSAVFSMALPWDKLDVVTWSWQKALGGEAQHGVLVLSPRAVERLETHVPAWPMPKIFRLTKGGRLMDGVFRGETINTPSMLCVEDALDALTWVDSIGGLPTMIARTETNAAALARWVESTSWVDFLAADVDLRSTTSVCLKIVDPWFVGFAEDAQRSRIKEMARLLEEEMVAFDIAGYRDAPPGLRIWCGATVDTSDVESLTAWLDWAYGQLRDQDDAAA